jgi:hypothetical protein
LKKIINKKIKASGNKKNKKQMKRYFCILKKENRGEKKSIETTTPTHC